MNRKNLLLISSVLFFGMCIAPVETQAQITSSKSAVNRIAASVERRGHEFSDTLQNYANFKDWLSKEYNINYAVDVSYMPQWGAPNGEHNANQTIISPNLSWTTFKNEYGTGTLNMSYTYVRYGNSNAEVLGERIGVVTPINDFNTPSNSFPELYYDYQLGGDWSWLSIALGQFPIYNFDGTQYDSNQQVNFINEALSQNASSNYAIAGVGSYVQIAPNDEWTFVAGAQDATNVGGISVRVNDLDEHHYTTFGSLSYTPTIEGLGQGQYAILLYNQPWVSARPQSTNGYSLNLSQNLGEKWGVFARANGVSGDMNIINQSYVLGAVYNNPLDRNPLDQIGFAAAYNNIDEAAVGEPLDNAAETVLEAYWAWGVSKWMTITPDVQFLINPALNAKSDNATVFSLRTTLFF